MNENTITIHIDHLGPIRDSNITLKPFMIFSGESGLGKSYTAFLVHFIYRILCYFDIDAFFKMKKFDFEEMLKSRSSESSSILAEFSKSEFEDWCNTAALNYLQYVLKNSDFDAKINIHFNGISEKFSFDYSQKDMTIAEGKTQSFFYLKINDSESIRLPKNNEGWKGIPFIVLFRQYLDETYSITQSNTFMLPPSRGALVGLSNPSLIMQLPGMYNEFLENLSTLKSEAPDPTAAKNFSLFTKFLMHGDIQLEENDMFYKIDSCKMPISAAASSIKELAPFALMLQKGVASHYAILFEEPESHLHPQLQIQVTDLLAYIVNLGGRMQITTHSDYLLRRINDLVRLDILKSKVSPEDYASFCREYHYNPEITISSSKLGAYYFKIDKDVVRILQQDVSNGVPFDTFEDVIQNDLANSTLLQEKLEELK